MNPTPPPCSTLLSMLTGKLQPIINASIPFGDLEILQKLLSTNRVGGKPIDYNEKIGYFFMYDNNMSRPYPSVIIWRYEKRDGQYIIVDNLWTAPLDAVFILEICFNL